MEDKNQISIREEKNEKNFFFPETTESEIQFLIRDLKTLLFNPPNNKLPENKKGNSNEIVRHISDYKYSSIIFQDLRNGKYIQIDLKRNKFIIFNLYDNKWIKESFIFAENIKSFWDMNYLRLILFNGRSSFEIVRDIFLVKNNRAYLNDEKKQLLRKNKTKLDLINLQIYVYQLMNEKNDKNILETNNVLKIIDRLLANVIDVLGENLMSKMNEDNDLLTLINAIKYLLREKKYRQREFTLGDKKIKYINSGNRGKNTIIENISEPLFEEYEMENKKENEHFIDNMADFVTIHFLEATE